MHDSYLIAIMHGTDGGEACCQSLLLFRLDRHFGGEGWWDGSAADSLIANLEVTLSEGWPASQRCLRGYAISMTKMHTGSR